MEYELQGVINNPEIDKTIAELLNISKWITRRN